MKMLMGLILCKQQDEKTIALFKRVVVLFSRNSETVPAFVVKALLMFRRETHPEFFSILLE